MCQLGAHDISFRPTNLGASKQIHPGSDVRQSEKQELTTARSLCDSGSIADNGTPIIRKSRGKTITACNLIHGAL
jgi:hypothetical protein